MGVVGGEATDPRGLLDCAKKVPSKTNLAVYSNFCKSVSVYKTLIKAGYGLILTYHPHVDPDDFLNKFA